MQKKRIMLVDGYNAVRRNPRLSAVFKANMTAGRDALIRLCVECMASRKDLSRIIVVFDGSSAVPDVQPHPIGGVCAVYTRTGESADDRIAAILGEDPGDAEYAVASDDRELAGRARRAGAQVMPISGLHELLTRKRGKRARAAEDGGKSSLSPRAQKEITDSLRRKWGVG